MNYDANTSLVHPTWKTFDYDAKTSLVQLAGEPKVVIQNDQPWEGPVVEAPFMWKLDGRYYLFYSGNGYVTPEYAVGYAVSDCITGGL